MSRRSAIVHIGMPKTGSTAIQGFLKDNRQCLNEHGCHFAKAPGIRNHAMLATYAIGEDARRGLMRRSAEVSFDWNIFESQLPFRIRKEVEDLPSSISTVIYSSEMLANGITDERRVLRLRDIMMPLFENIRIVVYLRRQDEAAVSAYTTALRAGGRTRFDILPDSESIDRYDYRRVLDVFAGGFGAGSVVPRIFERATLVDGDAVKDFLHVCGLDRMVVQPGKKPLVRGSALRADAQEFLRRFNTLIHEREIVGRKNISVLVDSTSNIGKPRLPCRQAVQDYYAMYRDINEEIRARYFPDRPSLFAEDFSRYPEINDAEAYSDANLLNVAFEVLLKIAPELCRLEADLHYMYGREAEADGKPGDAKRYYTKAARAEGGHRKARKALQRLDADAIADQDDTDTEVKGGASSEANGRQHRRREKTAKRERKRAAAGTAEKDSNRMARNARRAARKGSGLRPDADGTPAAAAAGSTALPSGAA